MVATSAGAATDKVIISDAEVPANGTFWIGLNPDIILGPYKQPLVGFVNTAVDKSVGTHIGQNELVITFMNCHYDKDGTGGNWEKFLRAVGYWGDNDNDNRLWLNIKDVNNYNIAKFPVTPYTGVSPIRGKINGAPQIDWAKPNYWWFNLQFVRLTLG